MKKQKGLAGQMFLDEIRDIDKLIDRLKEQIRIEEGMLMDTSVHLKDIQVQTSGSHNAIEEKTPEIVDLINQMEAYVKELTKKKKKALAIISQLEPRRQSILLLYYIQGKTLEQTAEEMDKSYTWLWDEMQAAVWDFSKIFEENSKSV